MAKINFKYYDGNDLYNDGIIEEKLLSAYKDGVKSFSDDSDLFFYTTNIRQNIINWYPFKPKTKILEIGAGVGPITGALLNTGNQVTSVEGSKRRASVIYERYKNYDNLTINCGNFNEMKFSEKFDYIVLIGVFEYARMFSSDKNAFNKFFENIIKNLKEDGVILIAIENKLGLKYLNGMSEDHFKKPYVGIEDYSYSNKFETFSRTELRNFVEEYGYKAKFYGVFPDYKLPSFIFSENYKPSVMDYKKFTSFNYYDDETNFDASKAIKSFIKGDLTIDVSNSFLVEISKTSKFADVNYVTFQNYRNKKYLTGTCVGNEIFKFPVFEESLPHLLDLKETHDLLNANGIPACMIEQNKDNNFIIQKLEGNTVLSIIDDYINDNDIDSAMIELDNVINYIKSISTLKEIKEPYIKDIKKIYGKKCYMLPISLFDLHLKNIIKDKNKYTLIDMEWSSKKQTPIDYNIFLIIQLLCENIPYINDYFSKKELFDRYNISEDKIDLFFKINDEFFNNEKKWLNIYLNKLFKEKNSGTKILDYKQNLDNKLKKELFDYEMLSFYKNELNKKNKEIEVLKSSVTDVNNKLNENGNKYNRKIYRLTNKLQNVLDKLLPYNSFRSRFILKLYSLFKIIVKFFAKLIRKFLKVLLYLLPIKCIRQKIIHVIHSSKKISKIMGECYYPLLPTRNCIDENNNEFQLNNKTWSNGKIAVHIHMYYTDLANEFFNYLKNIPYTFDLYISTPDSKKIIPLKFKFSRLTNVNKIIIKQSKNSGRDFGPMFVLFSDELKKYDYLLHLHTKKSLRVGFEQSHWRKYLLDNLIGTRELIMQYFDLMDNHNVGLAYPSTYYDIPLIAYSWLQNKEIAKHYFSDLGIEIKDEYLNFSAGSMFWCKVDSIKQLLNMNLSWDDFGVECGKDEGTLAHAFERIFGLINNYNNYNYATLCKDNKFHINYDDYNLINNSSIDFNKTFNTLNSYNIITFDLFDTLITRKIYNPDDVFDIIDKKICDKYKFKYGSFKKIRKNAEFKIRCDNNYIGDVDIHEIYKEIKNQLKINEETMNNIKNIEIDTDINLMIPRREMLDIFNRLKANNKQIIIISDMYYTKDIIERILHKCGYYGYYDILVSSDIGCRKDNGTMWDYFYKKYPNINSIHVGDNEVSDIHTNIKLEKPAFHIINGRKAYEMSKLSVDYGNNKDMSIIKGLIINKYLFNSPFSLKTDKGIEIKDLRGYGYSLLGPIFLAYFQWLLKIINKKTNLLFVSREGYFLQKIYNLIIEKSHKSINYNNYYFLISRRAISVPTIENRDDIIIILNSYYEGSLKELVWNRFGYMLPKNIENVFVSSPRDIDYILSVLEPYISDIIFNAKEEKKNYLNYINSLNLNSDNKNMIIDLGYSGTAQYYLAKLMNKSIDGAYFITSDNLKPTSLNDKVYSCFNDTIYDDSFNKHAIGKHSLFLEAFLTSNCGQLVKFDCNAQPIYLNSGDNNINKLNEIYEGVVEFINDLSEMTDKDILDLDIDKKIIENQFEKIILNSTFSKDIIETLRIEDLYCLNNNSLTIKKDDYNDMNPVSWT